MRYLLAVTLSFIVSVLLSASVSAADHGVAPAAIESTLGMKFVLVPAGEFVMGSDEPPDVLSKAYPQYERRRAEELGEEAPVHRVRITQPFYLGQFEVSVGQFRKFLEASGYIPEPDGSLRIQHGL